MPSTLQLRDLPAALRDHLGPRTTWWTVNSPFEILVGCVLVQNTNWRNVGGSLASLRDAGILSPIDLLATTPEELTALIRSSGFQTAKERALRGLCGWWTTHLGQTGPRLGAPVAASALLAAAPVLPGVPTGDLRTELRALRGIGPETADVIMLYLLGRGVFVADTYSRRLLTRLGAPVPRSYDALSSLVSHHVELDLAGWQEFHGLVDDYGKRHCTSDAAWASGPLAGRRLLLKEPSASGPVEHHAPDRA